MHKAYAKVPLMTPSEALAFFVTQEIKHSSCVLAFTLKYD